MQIHSIIWKDLPWLDDGWEFLLEGNGKNQCFCFVLFCFLVDVCWRSWLRHSSWRGVCKVRGKYVRCCWLGYFMTKQMTICTHLFSPRENIYDTSSRTARMGAKRSWIGRLMVDWSTTFPRFCIGRYMCNAHREKKERQEPTEEENHLWIEFGCIRWVDEWYR